MYAASRAKARVLPLLLALLLIWLAACSGKGSAETADLATLKKSMPDAAGDLPVMSCVSSDSRDGAAQFRFLSDLNYDLIEEYFFLYASAGTAEEIVVIQLRDAGLTAAAESSLRTHADSLAARLQEDFPDQAPLAQQALIFSAGRCAVLIVGPQAEAVQAAFYATSGLPKS